MSKLLPLQYAKILYSLTKDVDKNNLDLVIKEFLLFLRQERVYSKINYIIKEFVKYSKKQDGIIELKITSAQKLTDEKIEQIAKKFGEKTEVTSEVNKNIIGGVVVKSDNTILDASIKTQLNKLKQHLS